MPNSAKASVTGAGAGAAGQGQGQRVQRGPTAAWTLTCLSRRCHQAKHNGWTLTRHPDGSVTWLSPLGRTYNKPSPHERPQPTNWARWEGSPRWDATGLRLMPPAHVRNTSPADVDPDWDWDWGSRRKLPDTDLTSPPCSSHPSAGSTDPDNTDPDNTDSGSPDAGSPDAGNSSPGSGQSSGCDQVQPPAADPPPF